jgi:hypothetical protein
LFCSFFSIGLTSFVFQHGLPLFFELEGTAFFVTITGFVTLQLSKVSKVSTEGFLNMGISIGNCFFLIVYSSLQFPEFPV